MAQGHPTKHSGWTDHWQHMHASCANLNFKLNAGSPLGCPRAGGGPGRPGPMRGPRRIAERAPAASRCKGDTTSRGQCARRWHAYRHSGLRVEVATASATRTPLEPSAGGGDIARKVTTLNAQVLIPNLDNLQSACTREVTPILRVTGRVTAALAARTPRLGA